MKTPGYELISRTWKKQIALKDVRDSYGCEMTETLRIVCVA